MKRFPREVRCCGDWFPQQYAGRFGWKEISVFEGYRKPTYAIYLNAKDLACFWGLRSNPKEYSVAKVRGGKVCSYITSVFLLFFFCILFSFGISCPFS